jgi:hypothetical protein
MRMEEKWNDKLEIVGDAYEDAGLLPVPTDAELEAEYREWCRREGISPEEEAEAAEAIQEWKWNN